MAVDLTHHSGSRGPRLGVASRRRRTRVWIVAGIFVGFVGLAWAWAFQRLPHEAASGGVPVLVADSHPTREKPADPGGMQVPDIDPLSYDSGRDPPKVENILPAPEQPLPQPAPPLPPPPVVAKAALPNAVPATSALPAPVPSAQAAALPPVQLTLAAPPPPKPRPPRLATARPTAAAPSLSKPKSLPKPKAVATAHDAAKPAPLPAVPVSRPVASRGSGYLQLAAVRSATDALKIGQQLRQRYGALLRPFAFNYSPIDLGPRGIYYRILAGPMAPDRATRLCQSLKRRGAACLVAGP